MGEIKQVRNGNWQTGSARGNPYGGGQPWDSSP